ncbi:MAG: ABC transporter ATP-binding protein [Geminicoccaceae bacterium]
MSVPALRIAGLTKSFRGRRVVDGVEMTVEPGRIVGFLGPNGAGKTSVLTMVMGLLAPDAGEIALFGETGAARARAVRRRVGYLQEKPRLYPEMSARGYLALFARLYGVAAPAARVDAVLDRVGLAAAADRRLGTFSRGMQQRACLARVMLHAPDFLILDEPTLGLDPRGVADMRDIFRGMRAEGTTILFSSHQLAEIERVCDSVVFLSRGRVIAAGCPADLLPRPETAGMLSVELDEPVGPALPRLRALPDIAEVRETGAHQVDLLLAPGAAETRTRRAEVARALFAARLTPLSVRQAQPSLEDLFLALSGPRPVTGD